MITSFVFFMLGGLMALLMRAELARPGMQFLSPEQYNQLFTMHGTIMLLFFATPIVFAFANFVVPIQIGAPDVSFPRLNSFAYWLYLFGGTIAIGGFLTPGGAADFGWFAYTPLSDSLHSPGIGGNMWVVGLAISGLGTILGGVNMITTILTLRAPGMTMFRMPIMTWNILVTSLLVIMVFPFLAAALFALAADRVLGAHVFDVDTGGPMLWQHLFWFFGHPEVYIVALPFFGIITEVIPVFSRKPVFGYKGLVAATLLIAALSMIVWAHHMFVTGQVLLPFFSFLSFLIAVPTGMKFFVWIGTMWRGQISFETPMLFAHRLPGDVPLRRPVRRAAGRPADRLPRLRLVLRDRALPLRAVRHDRVRGVRRHLLLVPEDVRPDARRPPRQGPLLADLHRLPRHLPGAALARHRGHAPPVRRLPAERRLHVPEHVLHASARSSSALSTLPFIYNVWKSYKVGQLVTVDDPWGHGNSLEWATSCPPPLRNFDRMPRIRSERPAFDAKFPELAAGEQSLAGPPEGGARPLTSESDGGATYQEDVGRRSTTGTDPQQRPALRAGRSAWSRSRPAGRCSPTAAPATDGRSTCRPTGWPRFR